MTKYSDEVIEAVNRITREMRRKQKPLKELTDSPKVRAIAVINFNQFVSIRAEVIELLRVIAEEIDEF